MSGGESQDRIFVEPEADRWFERNRTALANRDLAGDVPLRLIPVTPAKVRYHHLPGAGVSTFKQDYAALFLRTRGYRPVAMLTSQDLELKSDVPDELRSATWLLQKRRDCGYVSMELQPR